MTCRRRALTVGSLLQVALLVWVFCVRVTAAQYLRMTWSDTDIVQVTYAEPVLQDGMKTFFGAQQVRVIDVREESFPMVLEAATQSTFHLLFMIEDSALTSLDLDTGELASFLDSKLSASTDTPADGSNEAAAGNTTTSTSFAATSVSFKVISAADAQALGPFPVLSTVETPSADQDFMVLHVFFRNMLSPANLTQGIIYQTRQGITRFLNLSSISQIYAAGPPEVPANSVLQVVQRYYLVLDGYPNVTLEQRESLANLLVYGDPSRFIDDYASNDGFFATQRPSMFLDYIMPAGAGSSSLTASSSSAADTALQIAKMDALFSYVFSSLTIDQFPPGNPPAPAPVTPATIIPGISTEMLASKMRKRQRFLYDSAAFVNSASLLPANVTFPSSTKVIQANATSACTMTSGFCTYIYWKNSLDRTFWLESMESVNRLAWNLFPSASLFATSDPWPTAVAPIILPGNTSTPIWTLGALSGSSNRLDFALNLRNADDNATSLKVEISTDIRSAMEATSTITSIARDTSSGTAPVYETKSNIVVNYQSRFRNANEMFLFLEIKNSTVVQKDTSQPCAHCQNLYEWCGSQAKCAALASCVFLHGIDSIQIPLTMLQSGNLQDVQELWPYFQNCMTESVELDAVLLLASAVRCQMQRLCAFRTSSYYGGSDDDNKILIWESLEGKHQVQTLPINAHFPRDTPVNISMRMGQQILCYVPIFSNATAESLQEKITRTCKLSKYLGRVSVSVNMTGESAATAVESSYDTVEIRYKYVVGPLPILEIVQPSAAEASHIQIATTALPGIRLRLETKDFSTLLPPAPPTTVPDPCSECNRLALDVCLRDLKCVAFTDCIMRHPVNSSSTPLGDAVLNTFRREPTGETISFTSAIDACHSSDNVNQVEWRKLVNASACFSKNSCPISMQMLVPNATESVGKWRISPEMKIQKLLYQQQQENTTTTSADPEIPLQLTRDAAVVKASTSSTDPLDLQAQLQKLLEYDDITVEVDSDSIESTTQLRAIQWSIVYHHWVGILPGFLPEESSPMWTLYTHPSSQDFSLEVLTKTALASNGTIADSNLTAIPV